MRKAIYKKLEEIYPTYYIGNEKKTTPKPYLILKMGNEIKTRAFGRWQTFTVFAIAPAGDFETLDTMSERIIKGLDGKHINRISDGSTFLIQFMDCGDEFVEGELNAISKQLNFKIPSFGRDFM